MDDDIKRRVLWLTISRCVELLCHKLNPEEHQAWWQWVILAPIVTGPSPEFIEAFKGMSSEARRVSETNVEIGSAMLLVGLAYLMYKADRLDEAARSITPVLELLDPEGVQRAIELREKLCSECTETECENKRQVN
jgi:hypothetical protein